MELSKADRKAAREIIEKGLQREYEAGMDQAFSILKDWKAGKKNNRDAYQDLYGHIRRYDKHIAKRYDDLSGSRYLQTIAGQITDEAVNETDLMDLSEGARSFIMRIVDLYKTE